MKLIKLIFQARPFFLLFTFVLLSTVANAQTCTLRKGDIIFTGYDLNDDQVNGSNTANDGNDRFSFVLLRGITANTEISFTDRGYINFGNKFQAADRARTDGIITWKANVNYPAGTEVTINCKFSPSADKGTIILTEQNLESIELSLTPEYLSLSELSGDQIFAFTGTLYNNPVILAGLSVNRANGWESSGSLSYAETTSAKSELPLDLASGANNFAITRTNTNDTDFQDAYSARIKSISTTITTGNANNIIAIANSAAYWEIVPAISASTSFAALAVGNTYTLTAPIITTQPITRTGLSPTGATTFSVVADATACGYEWQLYNTSNTTWEKINNGGVYSNATTATLNISNVAGLSGKLFRVVVSGAINTISNQVTLEYLVAVASVTNPANKVYIPGENIDFIINFNTPITVTGSPTLPLTVGVTTKSLTYLSGSGTSALTFRYTVTNNDLDGDGVALGAAITLSGGTLVSAQGTNANLTINGSTTTPNVRVDGVAPAVSSITTATANGSYKAGAQITLNVAFPENVIVNTTGGTPAITLNSNGIATYSTGSGTNTLNFIYTVGAGDVAADLDYTATTAFTLNGATIKDAATNNAVLTLPAPGDPGSIGAAKNISIDNTAPAIPTGFTAQAGNTQNVLSWTANAETDLKNYKIYGGTSANPGALIATVTAGVQTYTHAGLTNGTTYYYRIAASDLADNLSAVTATDVTATPKTPQTITFGTLASTVFGTAAPTITATGGGSGQQVTFVSSNTAVATVSGATITIIGVGSADITASQAGNGTYAAAADVVRTLNITPAPITVTAGNVYKTFGTTLTTVTEGGAYTITSGSLKNGNTITDLTISFNAGAPASANAGIYTGSVLPSAIVGGNGFVAGNYDITYAAGNLVVEAATITVKANNQEKTFGDVLSNNTQFTDFTLTSGTLRNGNTISAFNVSYGSGAPATSDAGTYNGTVVINNGTGSNGFILSNYAITYLPGDIIVQKAPLTLTPDAVNKSFGTTVTNTAGSTAFSISSGALKNSNTITSVTVAYGTGASATADAGTYPGAVTLSSPVGTGGFNVANYALTYAAANLIVDKAGLTLKANDANKFFGQVLVNDPASTAYTITGGALYNNNTITSVALSYGSGAAATANAGTYTGAITIADATGAAGFSTGNYNIVYDQGTIVVDKANIGLTANLVNKPFGTALTGSNGYTAFTLTSGTMQNGNTIASVTVNYGTGALSTASAGTYTNAVTLSTAEGANGFNASNYNITYVPNSIVVGKTAITLTANAVNKIYGTAITGGAGNTSFTLTNGSLQNSNTIASVTALYGTGALATADAGLYPGAVTISSVVGAAGFDAGNYDITYEAASIEVLKAPITLTADPANKTFGQALNNVTASTAFTISNGTLKNGNTIATVALDYGTGAAANANAGTYNNSVTASNPVGANGFNIANYNINYLPAAIVVSKTALTAKANDLSKIYDGLPITGGNGLTYSGFVNNDNEATAITGNLTYTGNAMGAKNSGSYVLTPSGLTALNYAITYTNGNVVISKAALTVQPAAVQKIYDAFPFNGGTAIYTGFADGDNPGNAFSGTLSFTGTAQGAKNTGTYVITPGGLNADNYNITFENSNLLITKAPLTIAAAPVIKTYDGAAFTGGNVGYTGFAGAESPADLTGTLTYAGNAQGAKNAGTFSITPGGFTSSNYQIQYTDGTLTINPKTLTVKAPDLTKVYDGIAFNGSNEVTYTGFVTGDNADNALTGTLIFSGTAMGAKNTGSYVLIPAGRAAQNYTLVYQNGSLVIGSKTMTVTAENKTKSYGSTNPALTLAYNGFVNGESIAAFTTLPVAVTTASATSIPDTYPITVSGGVLPNYTLNYVAGNLTVAPAALAIRANDQNKQLGETINLGTTQFTVAGLQNNEKVTSVILTSTGATATAATGNYAIVPSAASGAGFAAGNYAITYTNGNLQVSESANASLANLTVSNGTLTPAFASTTSAYKFFVNYNVGTLTFTPTAEELRSVIKVNGVTVASGAASTPVALAVGANTITVNVVAGNGIATKNYTLEIIRATEAQIINNNSGNTTVSNTVTEVLVTSPTQPVIITVPGGVENPTVNYNNLVNAGIATVPNTIINSPIASVQIAAATTVVSTNPAWDGVIDAPTVTTYTIPAVPGQITTTGLIVEVGDENSSLSFNKAVRLLFPGEAGKQVAFVHGGIYTEIINTGPADTQSAGDALPADGAFKIDVGADLVIWTKVFSKFITFSRTVDPDVALVAADKAALTDAIVKAANTDLATVLANLNTPATGSNGSAFTWSSSNTAVVSNSGVVTRPVFGSGNTAITLTATIKKGLITDNKTFNIIVVQAPNQAPTMAAIAAQVLCTTTAAQTIALTGITAGPETAQTTTLSVTSDNAAMFSALTVTGTGTTGTLGYTLNPTAAGIATVTITVKDNGGTANGGSDTFTRTFTVTANALPAVNIVSDLGLTISKGATARLSTPAQSGVTYTWANAAGIISGQNTASLTIRPEVSGTYTLTATNATGCTTVSSIAINVLEDYKTLLATNIVTPNGDGVNDKWVIANLDMYANNVVKVFDKAGRVIFTETNYKNTWDATINGSPLAEGTYYYTVDFGPGKLQMKGFISIVRNK